MEKARSEPCYQLIALDLSSLPVATRVKPTNIFSNTSSSKTRLAKDCPELIKKEAFMEIMLVMNKTLETVEVRQLCTFRFISDLF